MTPQTLPAEPPRDEVAARQRWMRARDGRSHRTRRGLAGLGPQARRPGNPRSRGGARHGAGGRGRRRGTLQPGEATVVRATVRLHGEPLADDSVGTSYVLGTDLEHARLAAIFDGLLADAAQRERVLAEVITPLEQAQAERDREHLAEARSTLADFFTVSREHE